MDNAAKRIGPLLATFLVAGNMIGSGIYLLPASLAAYGSSSMIAWIVGSIGALILAGVFAALARLAPSADGLADYSRQGLHPWVGAVAWVSYWIVNWAGNVGIALAAVGYLVVVFPAMAGFTLAATLVVIWGVVAINLLGPRRVAGFGGVALVLGLLPVLVATVLGLANFDGEMFVRSWNPSGTPITQALPGAVLLVFWAFLGLETANAVAAKIRDPERDLPIAVIGGTAMAAGIYLLACLAVQGVIPPAELAKSTAPFADVVTRLLGPVAGAAIAVCAALKALGTVTGWTLVAAETNRAGGAKGLLPRWLSDRDPAGIPKRDLLVTGILMSLVAIGTATPALSSQFNTIVGYTTALMMLVFALSALALVRMGKGIGLKLLGLVGALFSVWVILGWAADTF